MPKEILIGDALTMLRTLESESINCCVTSPPYWGLRDYGTPGQLGLEATPEEYTERMVAIFREVRRVLRDDGTLWLNLGDSYANPNKGGYKPSRVKAEDSMQRGNLASDFYGAPNRNWRGLPPKNLVGIPWRVAFALQADGWYLRSDIIWHKPNPMPESVTDRPTKSHEYVFLLSKSKRYWYDAEAVAEDANPKHKSRYDSLFYAGDKETGGCGRPGNKSNKKGMRAYTGTRNRRTVWGIATKSYARAHFATFPPELPSICIRAGCPPDGTVLDPFLGSGTTAAVAAGLGRGYVGIEINADYIGLIHERLGIFSSVTKEE